MFVLIRSLTSYSLTPAGGRQTAANGLGNQKGGSPGSVEGVAMFWLSILV